MASESHLHDWLGAGQDFSRLKSVLHIGDRSSCMWCRYATRDGPGGWQRAKTWFNTCHKRSCGSLTGRGPLLDGTATHLESSKTRYKILTGHRRVVAAFQRVGAAGFLERGSLRELLHRQCVSSCGSAGCPSLGNSSHSHREGI